MNGIRHTLVFVILIITQISYGQEKNEIIQQRIEFISEQLETEQIDLTNVVEALNYYYDHPINLNNADAESLRELNLLTEIQINDVLLHVELFGKFISIYELQSLTYWDLQTIQMIRPFVRVDDKLDQLHLSFKEAIKNGNFETYFRYQRTPQFKSGYQSVDDSILNSSNSYYHGNPDKYYSRFRYSYRTNLSFGITAEKDAGEEFFQGTQKQGFDFYSAHAFFKGGKYLKSVAFGDYQIQIGQGLNLWSGYAFGKSADATNVKKTANPIRPYTSVDETRFLRGAAFEIGLDNWSLLAFGSVKKVDASVIADSTVEDQEFVSSINLTGLHRTNSEIQRKDGLGEMIGGGNLNYAKRNFSLGIATVYQSYSKEYSKDTSFYNQFDFRGKSTLTSSLDYNWVFKNFNFFGELSHSSFSNGLAQIHGVLFSVDTRASMSVVYRNYQRNYHSFYNAGFSEGSKTQNETGIYVGGKFNLNKSWSLYSYVDFFKFPWMKYQVDAPSLGHEVLAQLTYKPSKTLEIYGRVREQLRQKNSRIGDGTITAIEDVLQRNYRVNFSYKIGDDFQIKSRIEYVTIERKSNEDEDGIIFTQDFIYKPKSFPLDLTFRYVLFDTDSYDTRIYSYENNALYVFSVPAYYYQGSRTYLLLRWSFLRHFDLWARYGVNVYNNRTSLGSGAEEIEGNVKSDITIQLRMKF